MQRIVDGGERDRHFGAVRLFIEHFRRHVPVALGEQDPAERHTLPGRTQADAAQLGLDVMPGTAGERAVVRLSPALLAQPLLSQPISGERGRRKSDRQRRFHNAPCFITTHSSPHRGRLLRTKSIYDSFPCRNRCSPPAARWHYALAAWWGCVFAPLCQYVSESNYRPVNRGAGPRMQERRSNFDYEDLLACGRGELFAHGPQLPLPPMLMFDRISEIAEVGGEYGKGLVRAVLDLKPDLWFFPCHFKGDPVMPGCLGLDALWQLLGFFLGWIGSPGKGRALGMGEIKFSGQVLPTMKKIVYGIDIKRVMRSKLVLGIADGWLSADGSVIYRALDLKVGLFRDTEPQPTGA